MNARNYSDLERRPHHVYLHRDPSGTVVYVGRTAYPETRPYETRGRVWMSARIAIEIQGPMSFTKACQIEDDLIREHHPRFNNSLGWDRVGESNPIAYRIRRECYIPRKVAIRMSEDVDPSRLDEEIAGRKRAMWGGKADDLDLSKTADRRVLRRRIEEPDPISPTVVHAARLDALRATQIEA